MMKKYLGRGLVFLMTAVMTANTFCVDALPKDPAAYPVVSEKKKDTSEAEETKKEK